MEHFYNCIRSVFTKLAEKPLQSMFSLILLLIFAQSSQEQKDQILQVILEYIQEPTKSYMAYIILVGLLLASVACNVRLYIKLKITEDKDG